MLKVVNNKILVNRGDSGPLGITTENEDGSAYSFKENDIIRFKIMKEKHCEEVIKEKDVIVTEVTEEVILELKTEDTTIGDIISNPVNYWYEVELNPDTDPQTIIGYDEEGPKILVLYPEGGKKAK